MSWQGSLYIHMYTDTCEPHIKFKNPDEHYKPGEGLLTFVYTDLSLTAVADIRPADLQTFLKGIHPYFRHIDAQALSSFTKNCFDPYYEGVFCLEGLRRLQTKYSQLLNDLAAHTADKAAPVWIKREKLFAQISFVQEQDRVWADYFLLGFEDCLILEWMEILRYQIHFKVCKNCGRLFITRKSNIDYCTRIFDGGKTCQEVGYMHTFAKSVKNDELLLAYTRAYKAHYARMAKPRKRAGNLSRDDFEIWYKNAKEKLQLARSGQLDAEVFKAWLKE